MSPQPAFPKPSPQKRDEPTHPPRYDPREREGRRRRSQDRRRPIEVQEQAIFIDLVGASGASYRYRAFPDAQSSMGGNFVVVVQEDGGPKVLMAGVTGDLAKAPQYAQAAGLTDQPIFVRLNVSSSTRLQDHQDIVGRYAPRKTHVSDL